jgi:hypothetical protein
MEMIEGLDYTYGFGLHHTKRIHVRVTRFELNPDHQQLCSFDPDDIRDGTRVLVVEENGRPRGKAIWQTGRVVDRNGKLHFDLRSGASSAERTPLIAEEAANAKQEGP